MKNTHSYDEMTSEERIGTYRTRTTPTLSEKLSMVLVFCLIILGSVIIGN